MLKIRFCKLFFMVMFAACSATKYPNISMMKQGITGYVYEIKGNQMPMIGEEPPKPKAVAITIFIYAATNINQVQRVATATFYTAIATKQITSVLSDSNGKFYIDLPAGSYSLFVKIGEKYYANSFNEKNDINLYTVEQGTVTEAKITINYAATY